MSKRSPRYLDIMEALGKIAESLATSGLETNWRMLPYDAGERIAHAVSSRRVVRVMVTDRSPNRLAWEKFASAMSKAGIYSRLQSFTDICSMAPGAPSGELRIIILTDAEFAKYHTAFPRFTAEDNVKILRDNGGNNGMLLSEASTIVTSWIGGSITDHLESRA